MIARKAQGVAHTLARLVLNMGLAMSAIGP